MNSVVARKISMWAENLPADIDYVDYLYNLFLSQTKENIDNNYDCKLSFGWNVWEEDFEGFVDDYKHVSGNTPIGIRRYLVYYTDYIFRGSHLSSREIAEHYGKEVFQWIADNYDLFHTVGGNEFLEHLVYEFGFPPNVKEFDNVHKTGMNT